MAQLIYFLIYIYFLLDIGISIWNVGFRLIIVIVTDEILHSAIREIFLELGS